MKGRQSLEERVNDIEFKEIGGFCRIERCGFSTNEVNESLLLSPGRTTEICPFNFAASCHRQRTRREECSPRDHDGLQSVSIHAPWNVIPARGSISRPRTNGFCRYTHLSKYSGITGIDRSKYRSQSA